MIEVGCARVYVQKCIRLRASRQCVVSWPLVTCLGGRVGGRRRGRVKERRGGWRKVDAYPEYRDGIYNQTGNFEIQICHVATRHNLRPHTSCLQAE